LTVTEARVAPQDLLRVADLDAAQLAALLDLAAEMKASPRGYLDALHGETLAMIFEKPSTRTRVSLSAAASRLGMTPLSLRPDDLQLGRGEPVADTARALSGYCAAICIRTFAHSLVEELAAAATVPVINALSDDHHPCQAIADVFTVRERFGSLGGLKLAYVGDGNNVCNSLVEAGRLTGMDIWIACPPGYEPAAGGTTVTRDPVEAVTGAHVVYTDVWVSMGEERERAERVADLARFRVDAELMRHAADDAVFLHCLPAHRGEEVTAEVIDGSRSAVWQQAANRMWTEEALISALVLGHFD
jgi:ornithine carbamoyltransferase